MDALKIEQKRIAAALKNQKEQQKLIEVDRKEKIILLVQERPYLWNKNLREYRDRHLNEAGWKEIADLMALPGK